ncbi:O-antigen ligase [Pedobacter sp. N36a]|uniref:O-antigen ligase family protein n=1 Tax=Pedobacter sp. N36a TaxID=2767996 RepID=UPI0016571DCC|nr:O-antigen ligase family protein [Pedobacter sp. N36a]
MAFSGVLPVIAVLIQSLGLGFLLIHNNPSFSETFRLENYINARPVGLTNEASFFVYQLFFSTLALYYAWKRKIVSSKLYYILIALYIYGVIVSISRTGLLIFALFFLIVWLRESKILTVKGFLKVLAYLPFILIGLLFLGSFNIGGFNLTERLLSSFNQGADLSTLERYGSAEALFKLILDKGLILGVGIYNFQYYIKDYLPDYMDIFYYPKGVAPASFNFIFQLFVEFGVILAVFFFYKSRRYIFNVQNDRFYKDWFLFLFIFSFSFQTLNFAIPFLIFFYPSKVTI